MYVGNFEPGHSTETHIALTLQDMGHSVIQVQEDKIPTRMIEHVLEKQHPDLFLYTRTWGMLGTRVEGMGVLEQCRLLGIPTASYHLDLYFGLRREDTMEGDPFWSTDFVFTPDGGHEAEFKAAGINHHYVRPGVYKHECVPANYRAAVSSPVAFIGSANEYHHEEYPYRRQLVEWLRSAYGADFQLWGNDTIVMRGKALNEVYASTGVVVGDSLCLGFTHPYYWSDRVYETLGRGGFIIHPYIKGMDEEFTDGESIVFYDYGDWGGLKDKIDYYLSHDKERGRIAQAGHEYVKHHATYHERLAEALAHMGIG